MQRMVEPLGASAVGNGCDPGFRGDPVGHSTIFSGKAQIPRCIVADCRACIKKSLKNQGEKK
jgi:hypothetical protein